MIVNPEAMIEEMKALREFVREQQEADLDALLRAVDRAINTALSIEVENLLERIRGAAALVGPVSWGATHWSLVKSGAYAEILPDAPAPSPGEFAEAEQFMAKHANPHYDRLAEALVAALRSRYAEGGPATADSEGHPAP